MAIAAPAQPSRPSRRGVWKLATGIEDASWDRREPSPVRASSSKRPSEAAEL